jgi:menaquinone-dependent protoporphyrinogen oxidase
MTVLVSAATKHGATGEIAKRIGADLAGRGIEVEVKRPQDVTDISSYEAVVLGSAVYFGNWMKEARTFLDTHADELAARPTWLFASGSVTGDPPVADDPNALRPSLAETLVSVTHAREHKLFAGKLDTSRLSLPERLPVRMARGREGDWRDWEDVDEWARAIADELARH